MNKNLIKAAGIAFLSAWAITSVHAQILTNGDFENTSNISITGFDNSSDNVPGWRDANATGDTASGVDPNGHNVSTYSNGGTEIAFSGSNDAFGGFQISGTTLSAGDSLTLTWAAINNYNGGGQVVSIISGTSPTAAFATTTALATLTTTAANLSTNWSTYSLTYTVTAADAGSYVGVVFSDPTPGGNGQESFTDFDNFVLTDVAVSAPEPSTYALLIGGLCVLFLGRRIRLSTV